MHFSRGPFLPHPGAAAGAALSFAERPLQPKSDKEGAGAFGVDVLSYP